MMLNEKGTMERDGQLKENMSGIGWKGRDEKGKEGRKAVGKVL